MDNLYRIDLKAKTDAYEIVQLRVQKNQKFNLPISKKTQNAHVLYVLEGKLQRSEGQMPLEKGECVIIQDYDKAQSICALENAKILMISATPKADDDHHIEVAYRENHAKRTLYANLIAHNIVGSHPIESNQIESLFDTVKFRNPFDGDLLNTYSDLFLSVLTRLPMEPLSLSMTYCARIGAQYVLSAQTPKEAFEVVVRFIARVYSELFIPDVETPIVRNAIYWTLLISNENKSVQYIADKLYMNRTHLSERFKECARISLSNYILRVKMYGAMVLFLDRSKCLSDVMVYIGYKDESNFIQNFKTFSGMTPNDFIKCYGKLANRE